MAKARETQQFSDFQESLNQNIELTKQLIPYWKKKKRQIMMFYLTNMNLG